MNIEAKRVASDLKQIHKMQGEDGLYIFPHNDAYVVNHEGRHIRLLVVHKKLALGTGNKEIPFILDILIEFRGEGMGYPHCAPAFKCMSVNGRWEVNKFLCTTFTSFHPEEWTPRWTLRTMINGLLSTIDCSNEGGIAWLPYDCNAIIRTQQKEFETWAKYDNDFTGFTDFRNSYSP